MVAKNWVVGAVFVLGVILDLEFCTSQRLRFASIISASILLNTQTRLKDSPAYCDPRSEKQNIIDLR